MRVRSVTALSFIFLMLIVSGISNVQVKRPFHGGTVWDVAFIKMKPGMETAYLNYIATDWKRNQEALKKAGLILSYKVITSEPHNPADFNIMLMTEYKDLASMEAGRQKADDLAQTVAGTDQVQMEGYRKRLEIREISGIGFRGKWSSNPKSPDALSSTVGGRNRPPTGSPSLDTSRAKS